MTEIKREWFDMNLDTKKVVCSLFIARIVAGLATLLEGSVSTLISGEAEFTGS